MTISRALDSRYPRRRAVNLCEVVIGGLIALMDGSTCGVDYIMSTLWLSRQYGVENDDHTDVRMT